jgi:hypothetical protein
MKTNERSKTSRAGRLERLDPNRPLVSLDRRPLVGYPRPPDSINGPCEQFSSPPSDEASGRDAPGRAQLDRAPLGALSGNTPVRSFESYAVSTRGCSGSFDFLCEGGFVKLGQGELRGLGFGGMLKRRK